MAFNKDAIWISNSSIEDFKKCPQLYFLRDLYKYPGTTHKLKVANPYLTLGEVVHDVLSDFSKGEIYDSSLEALNNRYHYLWQIKRGIRGGFTNLKQEEEFKNRGKLMIERFWGNKKISQSKPFLTSQFPKMPLFENSQDIILVGNLDWVQILPDESLHIIDFKTGKNEESRDSLQLPIYTILAKYCFNHPISKQSFWYLDRDPEPKQESLGNLEPYLEEIKTFAAKMVEIVKNKNFFCASGEYCFACKDYYLAFKGDAEHVLTDFNQKREVFFISK